MRRCVEKIGRSGEGDGVPGEEEGVVGVTSVGGGSVDESRVRVVDAGSDDEDEEEELVELSELLLDEEVLELVESVAEEDDEESELRRQRTRGHGWRRGLRVMSESRGEERVDVCASLSAGRGL